MLKFFMCFICTLSMGHLLTFFDVSAGAFGKKRAKEFSKARKP